MKTIEKFLKKCTANLDPYNMEECVSILVDDQGEEVARVDHNRSTSTCEPSIWIGEDEHILTEKEADYILDFLCKRTADELRIWNEYYKDNYDVRDEQGLYGYGY